MIKKGQRIKPFELKNMNEKRILVEFTDISLVKNAEPHFGNCAICFVGNGFIQPEYGRERISWDCNIVVDFYELIENPQYKYFISGRYTTRDGYMGFTDYDSFNYSLFIYSENEFSENSINQIKEKIKQQIKSIDPIVNVEINSINLLGIE